MQPKTLTLSVAVIFLTIAAIFYAIFFAQANEAKPYKKRNRYYLLLGSLCFAIIGLTGVLGLKSHLIIFNVQQFLFLIIGILHVVFLGKILPWTRQVSFKWRLFLTLNISLFGAFFLLIIYKLTKYELPSFYILSAIIWFFIPFIFHESLEYFFNAPEKIFKKWYYPVEEKIDEPTDTDLELPVVISFRFNKQISSEDITIFRAKAPIKMKYGKLFYYFINDYNERFPENQIEFTNKSKEPYPWIFFHKPGRFQTTINIDPDISIENNRIKENNIIDCIRIIEKDNTY